MKAFSLRAPNRRDESDLQKLVATMLRGYLPDEVWWTASLSGITLSPGIAKAAKASGMQKGAPDLSFIFPDGVTRYIELKSPQGVPTPEQAALAAILGERMVTCRSWPEVRDALRLWLEPYGLRFLTDTESYRRQAKRRMAA